MDFSKLMNVAVQNQQTSKTKLSSKKFNAGTSGEVSNDAVKAFLARKNAEKARQKEQEEAAKRARIQARLRQEQNEKSRNKNKPDSTKDSHQQRQGMLDKGYHNSTQGELSAASQSKPEFGAKKRTAHSHERKYVETKGSDADRAEQRGKVERCCVNIKEKRNNMKDGRDIQVEQRGLVKAKVKDKDNSRQRPEEKNLKVRADKNHTEKPSSKLKKAAAHALSFQELMNVAQRQANNPDAIRELMAPRQVGEGKKAKVEDRPLPSSHKEKSERLKNKKSSEKSLPATSKGLKATAAKQKNNVSKEMRKSSMGHQQQKTRKPEAKIKQKVSEQPKMTIERETISEKLLNRGSFSSQGLFPDRYDVSRDQRKRRYDYESDDDEYDDEMDEFIDDSEVAGPDVSNYIKEIFGYDKTKFRDRNDDIGNMESSFADIQREEAKSARIAKLEDEIERLKETYELQRKHTDKKKSKR